MLDFLKELLKSGLSAILALLIAFTFGTGAGAIVCWYYDIPLIFSIVGGILVLGIALVIILSDSM